MSSPIIYITTPAGNDLAVATALMSVVEAAHCLQEHGVSSVHAIVEGSSSIIHTRNHLARQFLESGCEWMFMHDADVILPRDAIWELYRWGRHTPDDVQCNVIGGTYPKRQLPLQAIVVPHPEYSELMKAEVLSIHIREKSPIIVRSLPAGCLLINRQVFVDLAPWVDDYVEVEVTPNGTHITHKMQNFFGIQVEEDPNGNRILPSEDSAFCHRVEQYTNHKVWFAPWVVCGHKGPFEYRLAGS